MAENGNVSRLSLTNIYVLDTATATAVLHRMQQRREEESKIARQALKTKEAELQKLAEEDASHEEARREYELYKKKVEAGDIGIGEPLKLAPKPRFLYLTEKKIMEMGLEATRSEVRMAESLAPWAEIKDTVPLAKVTSDVDGKFAIELPRSDVVLFAYTYRDVSNEVFHEEKDKTGFYCWLVTVTPTKEIIMLTNKNTVDTSAPENFAANR